MRPSRIPALRRRLSRFVMQVSDGPAAMQQNGAGIETTAFGWIEMKYKDILVYLDDGASNDERVKTALALAQAHGARLTGVVVNATPPVNVLMRLGISGSNDLVEKAQAAAEKTAAEFEAIVGQAGVENRTRIVEAKEGRVPQKVAHLARGFDLSIMRQANPDRSNADLVLEVSEEVLFSSGRPVLFMPYIGAHRIPCRRAMLAWDASPAATRALHDAMPMMEDMDEVVILVIDDDKQEWIGGVRPGEEISEHLSAHGIDNRVQRVVSGSATTSTIILNELSDLGVDLLIMGGYGTPKLREVVLGGVTRTLMNTMTVPVFMSH
ncbi:MAG: universal stress protein [Proteobacteria bacterium]|nr:MAG: universal stress protein [Pseudomonadota bacterium]